MLGRAATRPTQGAQYRERNPPMPATLNEAIATEPMWLQAWVGVLIAVNLAALVFVVRRSEGHFRIRREPVAIVVAFFAAAAFMGWLYDQVGYVRLLGLAHILFWGPVWAWLLSKRREIGTESLYGKYVHAYLGVAGLSLVIDGIDVVRYLAGDGDLWP